MPELTLQQFAAVMEYANENGRRWKSKLSDDWMYGRTEGNLQLMRNLYGPEWLRSFQPLEAAKAILRPRDVTITKKDTGEYRVNFVNGKEDSASYSEDIVDSVATGLAMAQWRDK